MASKKEQCICEGTDNISAKLIREYADLISNRSVKYSKSLNSGIFPDDWKCARVTSLFKQAERTDANNNFYVLVSRGFNKW